MNTKDVRVVVTRKMPAAVEAEIAERYDALFNRTDVALAPEQLVQVLQQADIVITTVTDKWHPGIFDTTSIRTKLLANVGVGVNHIALESARRRRGGTAGNGGGGRRRGFRCEGAEAAKLKM